MVFSISTWDLFCVAVILESSLQCEIRIFFFSILIKIFVYIDNDFVAGSTDKPVQSGNGVELVTVECAGD